MNLTIPKQPKGVFHEILSLFTKGFQNLNNPLLLLAEFAYLTGLWLKT